MPSMPPAAGGIRLLYVEDEAEPREMVSTTLARRYRDITIHTAGNGGEGLAAFRQLLPEIVITDIRMPIMDGIEMTREIKAIHPDTLVVATTAFNDTGYLLGAIDVGISSYIMKPIDYHKLFAVIDKGVEDIRLRIQFRESEERFRRAITDAPLPIAIHAEDGQILQLNKTWTALTGYELVDIPTMAAWKRHSNPDNEPCISFDVDQLFQRDEKSRLGECVITTRSGGKLVWDFSSAPLGTLPDGRRVMISMAVDITQRKRVEEKLLKNEQQLLEAQRIAHLGSWEWDLKEDRVTWTDEIYRIYGLDSTQHDLTYHGFIERVFPPDREITDQVVRQALTGGGSFNHHHRILRPDGAVRILHSQGRVVHDGTGKKVAMIGVCVDVTEQKQAEERIEVLNTNLTARASELELANQELEAFSYSVTHDLRKPLTVINGYCQVIRELCGEALDDQCRSFIDEIHSGTLRMNDLIDALLKFSLLTRHELHRERIDLSAMARDIAAELQHAEPERSVTFRIMRGLVVNADAKLFRVVMDNLLGNAWKYTGQREEALIEFGLADLPDRRACFVRDNGVGFNMADAGKMFIPFQRLPGSGAYAGHGIGLASVQRIIHRHGGKVWAESQPGQGATIFFALPQEDMLPPE